AIWHSIYFSLQYHPAFVEKYGAAHYGMAGDAMPVGAALAYIKEHPEQDKPEIYLAPGALKYSEMERLSKLALFQFLQRDPWFVIEAFAIKGAAILDILGQEIRLAWSTPAGEDIWWQGAPTWQRVALLCGLLAIGMLASLSSGAFRRLWQFAVLLSFGAIASLAIPFLTVVTNQVMSEEVMAILIMILMWASILVAVIARTASRYLIWPNLNEANAALYQSSDLVNFGCPIAARDGHDDERVPGVAAVVDDIAEGFENSVRQPVLAHELV